MTGPGLPRFEDMTFEELMAEKAAFDQMLAERIDLDRRRREYLDALLTAVGGDECATWADAHRAAFGEDVT